MCIICIFRYHYKNKETCLGQQLRRIFKREPASHIYEVPTYTRESHDTLRVPHESHDTQQVPHDRETTVAHPMNHGTRMLMQENSAYGTDIAIAPEIAAERNVAYGHTSRSDTIVRPLLQHVDTSEIRIGSPVSEYELESRTDTTSTTTYSAIFPCPIIMNLPGQQ
jgi:hypothetical protein